jgi:hypothetical protein
MRKSRLPKRNYVVVDRRVLKALGRETVVDMAEEGLESHKTKGEALQFRNLLKKLGSDVQLVKLR